MSKNLNLTETRMSNKNQSKKVKCDVTIIIKKKCMVEMLYGTLLGVWDSTSQPSLDSVSFNTLTEAYNDRSQPKLSLGFVLE